MHCPSHITYVTRFHIFHQHYYLGKVNIQILSHFSSTPFLLIFENFEKHKCLDFPSASFHPPRKANSQICHIFYQQYLLFKTNAYFLYFHHLSNIINTQILHQHYLPQRQKLRFSISTIPTHLEQQILTFFISNISNILIFKDKRLLFVFYNARFIS